VPGKAGSVGGEQSISKKGGDELCSHLRRKGAGGKRVRWIKAVTNLRIESTSITGVKHVERRKRSITSSTAATQKNSRGETRGQTVTFHLQGHPGRFKHQQHPVRLIIHKEPHTSAPEVKKRGAGAQKILQVKGHLG